MTSDTAGIPIPDRMDNLPPLSDKDVALILREGACDPLLSWAVEEGIDLAQRIYEDLLADGRADNLAWPVPEIGGRFEQVMHAACEEELRRLRWQS